ncbi:MAG: acyl-CoA thioesterase [Cytophagales bacterium]|nr:acyl-CoA thioesterase [Cytophagales bacterium]
MLKSEIQIRVRYAETDKMGYVYYGNYATYFEVARVEMLREHGVIYNDLENESILMPVASYTTKYILPAKYDDNLTIKTTVSKKPTSRMVFTYEVYNQEDQLLTTAETTLVFVSAETGRPIASPRLVEEKVGHYFE